MFHVFHVTYFVKLFFSYVAPSGIGDFTESVFLPAT
jgi:hypothetical protein